ncbi:MAG: hypothetical protein C0404_06620, partial [Verrucomicrobia bacterium]|nr:hypothetical protein [Verrucomicrobiota bacterium]
AAACVDCGACEPKCPQKISIPRVLRRTLAELGSAPGGLTSSLVITGGSNGVLQGRLIVKNLGEIEVSPQVHVTLAGGATCIPGSSALATIPPDSAVSTGIQINFPDGLSTVEGAIEIQAASARISQNIRFPILLIPENGWRRHSVRFSPADFGGNKQAADNNHFTIALNRNGDGINVRLDLAFDSNFFAKAGDHRGSRMEVFLDMRPGGLTEPDSYGPGVDKIFMSIVDPAYVVKFNKTADLQMTCGRRTGGSLIAFHLPFAAFRKPEWPIQKSIGLDFMYVIASSNGMDIGYPTLGGKEKLTQHPRRFTRAYLC